MVSRSQVYGLGFEELAFRAEEIRALALQNYHLTMPASAAQELAEEMEGWITGLLLSAQTMWQGMVDRVRLARVSGVGLYDYLAQQVLDQQPDQVRDFLLHTALLEEFDAGLCEAVLGASEDWQSLMDTVLHRNLFVLPVEDGGTWLRYHHLFQDFLQARLAEERPDEKERILRRLAVVYAEREAWEKAHDMCRRLGDTAATADLIEQAGASMAQGGRWATLAEWLDALPEEALDARPALVSLRGTAAVMLGEVRRGLMLQNQAEAAFRATGDRPHLARTLVRRAIDHRLVGDYQASLADAREALALTEEDGSPCATYAEALRVRGLTLYYMGQVVEATQWLAQSLAAYDELGDDQGVAMLLLELGLAHMSAGRYDQALAHYSRALDRWRETDNVTQQANLLNNLGVLYHLKGDYEQAGLLLEEGLDCARRSGYARLEAYTLCSIGDLYADLDAPDAALDAYRQARQVAQRVGVHFLPFYLNLAEAALAHSRGDRVQAHELMASAERLTQKSGSGFEQGLHRLQVGRLALVEGDSARAVAHLREAVHRFGDGGQRAEESRAQLYLAAAYQASEDGEATLVHLEQAFHLAVELESQHTLVVAGREARPVLEVAQRDPALGPSAAHLLQQVTEFEEGIPAQRRRLRRQVSVVSLAPPTLSIQTLGRAQVMLDGKPVTDPEWQSRRIVRELFFLLLAHPDGLTKEAVGLVFWPDDSPPRLKLRFKNAIYRLRRALGREVVLFDGNLYQFSWTLDYEYDVEAFRERLAQAQAAIDDGERAVAYQAAIHLDKGPYLPEVKSAWARTERERLWWAYLEAVLRLTELCLAASEYEATLDYCQRVLAQDPCLEEIHRLAMRAYAAMGNRAAVARQFERCRQALLEEINVFPSPQTEALYETLMR
jgi:ATP/maltotriose-dependent transcriptional regulator MalT/DNA-binding SARP family transcriptional activator